MALAPPGLGSRSSQSGGGAYSSGVKPRVKSRQALVVLNPQTADEKWTNVNAVPRAMSASREMTTFGSL